MRSGATTSRQPRRRLAAVGLVLLAGVVAGGAVLVVSRIERDLDRRIARSLREAGAAVRIDHPNVVRTYDLVEDAGSCLDRKSTRLNSSH